MTLPSGFGYNPAVKSDVEIRIEAANMVADLIKYECFDPADFLVQSHALFRWIKSGEPVVEDPESVRSLIKDEVGEALRRAVG